MHYKKTIRIHDGLLLGNHEEQATLTYFSDQLGKSRVLPHTRRWAAITGEVLGVAGGG